MPMNYRLPRQPCQRFSRTMRASICSRSDASSNPHTAGKLRRQPNRKRTALAERAVDLDAATHGFNELLHERQSKPRTRSRMTAGPLIETLEHAWQSLWSDAFAGVAHLDVYRLRVASHAGRH